MAQHVCPWWQVWTFDNFFRPLLHNIPKLYSPYVKPGMRVLDVGCGAGFTSLGLARLVGEQGKVFAVDMQPQMLAMVKRRAAKANLEKRIILHQCQQHSLGLKTSVDFVNAFWMVHEIPDIPNFLAEVYGMLKSGGRFLIAEPSHHVKEAELRNIVHEAERVGLALSSSSSATVKIVSRS